jgi:hypothetical protein
VDYCEHDGGTNFPKNVGAASKFKAPEGLQKQLSSVQRTCKSHAPPDKIQSLRISAHHMNAMLKHKMCRICRISKRDSVWEFVSQRRNRFTKFRLSH